MTPDGGRVRMAGPGPGPDLVQGQSGCESGSGEESRWVGQMEMVEGGGTVSGHRRRGERVGGCMVLDNTLVSEGDTG